MDIRVKYGLEFRHALCR